MSDPTIQNAINLHTLVNRAIAAPPRYDEATLDAVEAVIIRRRSLTRHTADAKAVTLVLADVQKLRATPDGDAA